MTPTDVIIEVTDILDRIGIPYLVGGSYASGIHGVPRSTNDADLVVNLSREQIRPLVESLGAAYYADAPMMEDSLRMGISFNIVHMPTQFKIDFFPVGSDPFRTSELQRRTRRPLGARHIYVSSAEDTLLAKLCWYRDGGEESDRQWRDILGVIEVRGGELDREHLERWARRLDIADLLERALGQARPPSV